MKLDEIIQKEKALADKKLAEQKRREEEERKKARVEQEARAPGHVHGPCRPPLQKIEPT